MATLGESKRIPLDTMEAYAKELTRYLNKKYGADHKMLPSVMIFVAIRALAARKYPKEDLDKLIDNYWGKLALHSN